MTYSRTRLFQISLGTFFAVLLLLGTSWCDSKTAKSAVASCDAALNATGIDFNTATNVNATDLYKDVVATLLKQEHFKEVDCIADEVRTSKAKFSGGFWKLHILYTAMSKPQQHTTEKDWKDHLAKLNRWKTANPTSITARVALAQSYSGYAWSARGNGGSETVSANGQMLFEERLKTARRILTEADRAGKKDPEWFVAMQSVARDQEWPMAEAMALLQKAITFEPEYYYFYRMHENFLQKWQSEAGEAQRFVDEVANKLGEGKGDVLYFQAASCDCLNDLELKRLSWARIQKGYVETEKKFGPALSNQNQLARLAVLFRDAPTAYKAITQLGDRWDRNAWGDRNYFEECKTWATESMSTQSSAFQMRQIAQANESTPAGARYKELLQGQLSSLTRACIPADGRSLDPFELLIGVGREGLSTETMRIDHGPVSNCLIQKFRTTIFPAPPQPHYWLRFEIDPAKELNERRDSDGSTIHQAK